MGATQSIQKAMPEIRRYFRPDEFRFIENQVRTNPTGLITKSISDLSRIINNKNNASSQDISKRELHVKIIKALLLKSAQPTATIALPRDDIIKIKQAFGEDTDFTKEVLKEVGGAGTNLSDAEIAKQEAKVAEMCENLTAKQLREHSICRFLESNKAVDSRGQLPGYSGMHPLGYSPYGRGGKRRSKKSKKSKKSRKVKKTRRHK
jgi:hypothetical protein